MVFPIYVSDQKFEDSMDLLLLIDNDKSHYVYIKDFDRSIFHKTKNKNKKWFCKSCAQCFSNENELIKHKENCLKLVSAILYQIFIFESNDRPSKTMKNIFCFI